MAANLIHCPWRDLAIGDGPEISTSLLQPEADRLADLASRAGTVLEVGSAFGYSAIVMARAGAVVTAVDWHAWLPDSRARMEHYLDVYGVSGRVAIVQSPSSAALARFAREGQRFGLVFIDGDHRYDQARADITAALAVLGPGGTIAVHDYGEDCSPDVMKAVDELLPLDGSELTGTLFTVAP